MRKAKHVTSQNVYGNPIPFERIMKILFMTTLSLQSTIPYFIYSYLPFYVDVVVVVGNFDGDRSINSSRVFDFEKEKCEKN